MTNNKVIEPLNLKQYQPFGMPLLKLMFVITFITLSITLGYELLIK